MTRMRQLALLAMLLFSAGLSVGSDCDLDIIGDEDGFSIDFDEDDDDFWDDLFDD